MEHRFTGPAYTLGIEEELMILDEGTLDLSNSIESILSALPRVEGEPQVKEELMESVVEVMTTPAGSIDEVGEQLRGLRRTVQATARECGLAIASAGTHPFALWEEQRIVARPRYQQLVSALRWVARQELIFGVHVHVGVDGPEKAIHVALGVRHRLEHGLDAVHELERLRIDDHELLFDAQRVAGAREVVLHPRAWYSALRR